jgi:hypothetical protein
VIGPDGECARCKAARLAGQSAVASDLRGQANEAIQRLLREDAGRTAESGPAVAERPLARQTVATPTGPGGGGCEDLLQAIIDLLNEVAQRFNDALNDPHGLYEHHRTPKDAHPDYGSWDGHRDRYNYDRDRLRHKLAEWDANDDCRGFRFNRQQQQDMDEAKEFAEKEFPARPAPSMSRSQENEQSVWDKLRQYLPDHIVEILIGLGAVVVAGAIIACFATGVCEFAAVLGGLGYATAALIMLLLRQAGVRDEPAGGPIASSEPAPDDGLPSAAT